MFSQIMFSSAACLLVAMGFIHSYLGEKFMFRRLFEIDDLPLFRSDRIFTERVLRFAWHITSLAWMGFAAQLVLLSFGKTSAFPQVIAAIVAAHGIFIVGTCGARHPAWLLFLLAAVLIFMAI